MSTVNFEKEILDYFQKLNHPIKYFGNTYDQPDFYFPTANIYLEVKEKDTPYNVHNWPISQQNTVFIMDEVSVRRMVYHGTNTALLIRDNTNHGKMYFSDLWTLLAMPHKRVNRPVAGKDFAKGKWILDLRNFTACLQLTHMLHLMNVYSEDIEGLYQTYSECQGDFLGEDVPLLGNTRNKDFQKSDPAHFVGDPF